MARTYRRRYTKTIVRAPKKTWNTSAVTARYDVETFNGVNNATVTTIVSNSLDNTQPTPTVIQAKHIKVYGLIGLAGNATESGPATPVMVMSYIVYIPQIVYELITSNASQTNALYNVCLSIVRDHPEWVMSQKNVNVQFQGGFPGEKSITKFTQTSGTMKRNLKSGDRIVHILTLNNFTSAATYNRQLYYDYQFSTSPN